jgi:peptide-methionine (R)-S-oxide reductase
MTNNLRIPFLFILVCNTISGCQAVTKEQNNTTMDSVRTKNPYYSHTDTTKLKLSDEEWKKVLTPEVYAIARGKGTERAFTGKYWDYEGKGTYYCAACGNALFKSDAKFASSCGWPSYYETIRPNSVNYVPDHSFGMERIEVICGRCEGHLGHIFDDGPPPTFKRFCMNSEVLEFEPEKP